MTRRRGPRFALGALIALALTALAGCTSDGDRSNPAEGWTPEDGFVRSWER